MNFNNKFRGPTQENGPKHPTLTKKMIKGFLILALAGCVNIDNARKVNAMPGEGINSELGKIELGEDGESLYPNTELQKVIAQAGKILDRDKARVIKIAEQIDSKNTTREIANEKFLAREINLAQLIGEHYISFPKKNRPGWMEFDYSQLPEKAKIELENKRASGYPLQITMFFYDNNGNVVEKKTGDLADVMMYASPYYIVHEEDNRPTSYALRGEVNYRQNESTEGRIVKKNNVEFDINDKEVAAKQISNRILDTLKKGIRGIDEKNIKIVDNNSKDKKYNPEQIVMIDFSLLDDRANDSRSIAAFWSDNGMFKVILESYAGDNSRSEDIYINKNINSLQSAIQDSLNEEKRRYVSGLFNTHADLIKEQLQSILGIKMPEENSEPIALRYDDKSFRGEESFDISKDGKNINLDIVYESIKGEDSSDLKIFFSITDSLLNTIDVTEGDVNNYSSELEAMLEEAGF